ncbi:MAG: DUF1847 domain-containing protein [Candidatus Aminicenantaceae bacterium]
MINPTCAYCVDKPCYQGITDPDAWPGFCPMRNFPDLVQSTRTRYRDDHIHRFFLEAAITEREAYAVKPAREEGRTVPVRPRIRELSAFAHKLGIQHVGLAFCVGLAEEAKRAARILENRQLKVSSVCCACGVIDKTELGIPKEEKIRNPENFEASCNPLLQAEVLNRVETGFNIIVGLCVGHDMLFTKYSRAPVTTLVVKDRFTGHNPVITLYSRYHRELV